MGLRVMFAGQDVSKLVQESSISLNDTLGQGAGVVGGSSGRAATLDFLISGVGPAAGAVGAGSALNPYYTNMYSAQQADIEGSTFTAPDFKTGVGAGGSLSRDTAQFWHGTSSAKVVMDGTGTFQSISINLASSKFLPGVAYTVSFYALATAGQTPSLRFFWEGNDGITGNHSIGSTGSVATPVSSGWTRYSVTATMPNPIVDTYIGLRLDTGSTAQAITFWLDGLQIEESSSAHTWIPGGTSSPPSLVRYGEVQVFDNTNTCIYGGYAVKLEDQTIKKTNYVKVSCVDYWQYLDTIIVNKVYVVQTDLFIIEDLLTTYASWVSQSSLPTTPSLTLSIENYQHFTLQKALQRITDKTGYLMWIDPLKTIHYVAPTHTSTASFALSDTPNFSTTFQCGVDDYTLDDTAAINRVFFYGGKHLSTDIVQDMTTQVNGTNDLFIVAYYPHKATDGHFHLKKNGTDVALGIVGGTGAANTLISAGGSADALINIDAHTIQWSTAPAAGATVTFTYRREIPLIVVIQNNESVAYYGRFLDGVISDQSVFDQTTAVRRCQTLLFEQAFGLETLQLRVWKGGLSAGQLIRVDHSVRNLHKSFIIQSIQANPKGGGFFEYTLTLGAWHANLVDIVMQLARNSTPEDDSSSSETAVVQIESLSENIGIHDAATATTHTMALFYPRLTPVGDGHDAYPGLFSI